MAATITYIQAIVRRLGAGAMYRADLSMRGSAATTSPSFRIFPAASLAPARTIDRYTSIRSQEEIGRALFEILCPADETPFGHHVRELLRNKTWEQRVVLQLRLGPTELVPIPWELMAAAPDLNRAAQASETTGLEVVRAFTSLPSLPGTVSLPIQIGLASLGPANRNAETEFDLQRSLLQIFGSNAASVPRTFRTDAVTFESADAFVGSLGATRYDIVHLVGDAESFRGVDVARLTGTRLLILHVRGGDWRPRDPLLRLGHRMAKAGVPAVIVSRFAGSPAAAAVFYHHFYDALVHDLPIDRAVQQARDHLRYAFQDLSWGFPALFAADNAYDLLRVSPIAVDTKDRAEAMLREVELLRTSLERIASGTRSTSHLRSVRSDVDSRLNELLALESNLKVGAERATITSWDHESGGVVPLGEALFAVEAAAPLLERERKSTEDLAQVVTDTKRVVNTYFRTTAGIDVPGTHSIVAREPYDFIVQIGPRLPASVVKAPAAIPEAALEPFFGSGGLELEVALFSSDFDIENDRQPLLLRRSGPTKPLVFRVTAPRPITGARLRVGVYFRHNLLQSLMVTAVVGETLNTELPLGNTAGVEYALSGDLENLEQLPARTLNIVTNESPDGTHTLDVLGSEFKREFTISAQTMSLGAARLRKQLLSIGSVVSESGVPTAYLYNADNTGSSKKLGDDLLALAAIGFRFYAALAKDLGSISVADQLRKRLAKSATIQVSAVKSAKYVFPWALVYDKPLVLSPSNQVCDVFMDALDKGGDSGFLEQQECIAKQCPHNGDPNVICPSGFWGYKHTIEQPPSVYRDDEEEVEGASDGRSTPLDIVVRGKPNLLMVVNQDLDLWSTHADSVAALREGGVAFVRREQKKDLGKAIVDPHLHLVYFYCHGRTDGEDAWLAIGAKKQEEALHSFELMGWNVRWTERPLVFINGCGTVECSPDELLPFLDAFVYHEAAGVIGTEIAVPEVLAETFALEFLKRFLERREPVGPIIRGLRLSLLEKRNLLGLGYTPYCLGALRMHVQEAPTLDVLMLEARRSPDVTTIDTEAPALEKIWKASKLSHRIVSNDVRYRGAVAPGKGEFLEALHTEWSRVLHLAVHGNGTSLALAWSDAASVSSRVATERLTPREIATLALDGTIVVSGACSSGMQTLVDAFRAAGARAYVAPSTDVEWAKLVPFFSRFYEELATGRTVTQCIAAAAVEVPDVAAVYDDRIGDGTATLERN